MTVLKLQPEHYKHIDCLFYNFVWNEILNRNKHNNCIRLDKICKRIDLDGFGMINYNEVVDSIRCRLLGILFNESFNNPLKKMVIIEDKKCMSGRCITKTADSVTKEAYTLIIKN